MLPDQAVYSNLKASALVLSRTNLFCLPPWQRGHHACLAPRCLGMWRCLSKFFQWNGCFSRLQELTLHAMALVFGSRRFFARLFEWFAFGVIPGTRTQVPSVDWTGCLEAWQRPRPHYTSQRRWFRVLASRHVQGGCCLVRVGLTDARPGRWLLRDLQAELPTGRGFLDVGGDPKPGSRYDIFLGIRQGVELVWSTKMKMKQPTTKCSRRIKSTQHDINMISTW